MDRYYQLHPCRRSCRFGHENLQHFVRHKHQQAGNAIIAGENAISPYSIKSKTACDFCNLKLYVNSTHLTKIKLSTTYKRKT